jgi:hypothetical protein
VSAAPTYAPAQLDGAQAASLASDWDPSEVVSVGLPPRVLEAGLRKDVRMVRPSRLPAWLAGCLAAWLIVR